MSALGADFGGGWFRRLYTPENPAGLFFALCAAAGLVLLHQVLVMAMGHFVLHGLSDGGAADVRDRVKASLAVILPASLVVVAAAWWLAGRRGGTPAAVLSLRRPGISGRGWIVLIAAFMLSMYAAIVAIILILGIDIAQYTPGPDGSSPSTGSAGLVKEAMFDIANEPLLFLLVFPSVAIGAPLAEEVIFRGQLFSALSQTRVGVAGATLVTSAAWAMLHISEPWLSVGLIFVMGLVLGWLMYRFRSLWVVIACHGAWNAFYSLIVFAGLGGAA